MCEVDDLLNELENEEMAVDFPENTIEEIIVKISAFAYEIREDFSDPRFEANQIVELCSKLSDKLEENER